ncbi:MAG: ABC transporter permease [Candidatus Protistobacter heckmanni]|nr:ABC transporter permease [Candidatus Protistobacter heckmanni]
MSEALSLNRAAGAPLSARLAAMPGIAWTLSLLILGFALLAPGFLSLPNLSNIGVQSTLLLLLALPMTLIIMTEGLDLSMGAVLSLCTVSLALVNIGTGSLGLALLAALAAGLLFGLLNGLLVARLELPPFVVTLGTLGAAQGVSLVLSDGRNTVGVDAALRAAYDAMLLGIPAPVWLGALAYALMHVLLYHTRFGTYVFALGGNREALRLRGVRATLVLTLVYVLGEACVALASVLMSARINGGHPMAAVGMEFDAIAAVVVGGTAFERGKGWLFGSLLGVIAIRSLRGQPVPKELVFPATVINKSNYQPLDVPANKLSCPKWENVPGLPKA